MITDYLKPKIYKHFLDNVQAYSKSCIGPTKEMELCMRSQILKKYNRSNSSLKEISFTKL